MESTTSSLFFPGGWTSPTKERPSLEVATGEFTRPINEGSSTPVGGMETTEEEPEREAEHEEAEHEAENEVAKLQEAEHKAADVPAVIEVAGKNVVVIPKEGKEGKKKWCVIM